MFDYSLLTVRTNLWTGWFDNEPDKTGAGDIRDQTKKHTTRNIISTQITSVCGKQVWKKLMEDMFMFVCLCFFWSEISYLAKKLAGLF